MKDNDDVPAGKLFCPECLKYVYVEHKMYCDLCSQCRIILKHTGDPIKLNAVKRNDVFIVQSYVRGTDIFDTNDMM